MNIEIDLPEGTQFEKAEVINGKVFITAKKPLTVFEKYDTIDKVLKDYGYSDEYSFDYTHIRKRLSPDEIAYKKLKMIVACLNSETANGSFGYAPRFTRGSSGFRFGDVDRWATLSSVGSRLEYHSHELAKFGAEKFIDIYKAFLM